MKKEDVIKSISMPATSPSFPKAPYRFINREYFIINYETDMDALRAVVPEPLEITEPIVKYEFIKMPDSSGLGDYTESGQVIPVSFQGKKGGYIHSMYLDNFPAIVAGREIWGFPKKLATPKLYVDHDALLGVLNYNDTEVARASMGFKFQELDKDAILKAFLEPNFLLKIIPHVDGSKLRVCELIRYYLTNINIKGAWSGPAALKLSSHALAPVADLPIKKVLSAVHILADLTLPYGEVVHDYLADIK